MELAARALNLVAIILPIIATVVVIRKLRGTSLAVWLLVIWFIPLIGPLVALFKSNDVSRPRG